MRRYLRMTLTVILIGITAFVTWAGLTHRVSYVVTNGVSMQPLYHAGDLVVVAKADSYRVGDVIAYRVGSITLLHRIIDGDANGWVTKGDNNQSIDPPRPTSAELIGRAVLHIPAGGTWLKRATSPPVLGAIGFFMAIGAGGVAHRRRRRRSGRRGRPRGATVGSKLASASQGIGRATVSAMARPRMRVAASAVAAAGLLGATLGVAAWTQPVQRSVSMPAPPAASMTFSYATTVPLTPAYDGTTVTSPAPVFRSVAEGVDVTFAYAGPPGKVAVDAELANATGWHSTIPLAEERSFTGNVYRGVVRLDLDSLEARANAGATAIGVRSSDISVRVVPRVTGATGTTFAPALKLKLTPVALTPDGAFVVKDAAPAPAAALVPQEMSVAGRTVARVSTLRTVSTLLILGAILAAAALFVTIRRTQPATEGERIRRRYRQLLVEVEPIEPPSGRPVFRVTEFKTLTRLAERYGLLVLYWSTPPSTTFAVHEDTATYWYCTDAVAAPVPTDPAAQQATAEDVTEAPEHWQISLPDAQDPLTKLGDQSLLVGELQFALDASGGERLCLMLISLDNLPLLSETFGPGGGDAVLVTIAERLRRTVRPRDLVARLGNDDFAVVFDNVGQVEVDSIAKRVMRSVDESIFVQGQQVRVRTSLGVASASPSQDATALMARATTALADAKAAATQHLAWFTETATGQDLE